MSDAAEKTNLTTEARRKAKIGHECSTTCQEDSQSTGKPPATDATECASRHQSCTAQWLLQNKRGDLDDEEDAAMPVAISGAGNSGRGPDEESASRQWRGVRRGKNLRRPVCCPRGCGWLAGRARDHSFSPRKEQSAV